MSILHLNQIERHLSLKFKDKIDLMDVSKGKNNNSQENFFLTRALSAYSLHFLAQIGELEAAEAVTDGSNDNGLDAILFDKKNSRLYLVQSKWIKNGKGEPSSGDIHKFIQGITDLINLKFEKFNEKIRAKKEEITAAISNPTTKYSIVVCYTGVNGLAEPSNRLISDFVSDLNDASEIVDLEVLRQSELHDSIVTKLTGSPIDVLVNLKQWGRIQEPYTAYYGQVSGKQIANLWKKHHERLFSKNLRSVLGDTDINQEMRITLASEPEKFWYYNNGITLIASQIKKTMQHGSDKDIGEFSCEDISVVNGAQTVATIGRYAKMPLTEINKVTIPIRIISLADSTKEFGKMITRTNNRQNKIENRDFVVLDPEQDRIKSELAVDGINYFISRGMDFEPSEESFDLVESTTALACASGKGNVVVQLKREIGKLWEDIESTPYKLLFNPQTSGVYIWRCVRVQRYIDKVLNNLITVFGSENSGILIHGNRIISALVFSQINEGDLQNPKFDFESYLTSDGIENLVKMYSEKLIDAVSNNFSENTIIPTLFKNRSKCEVLIDHCKNKTTASTGPKQLTFDLFSSAIG